MQIPKGSIGRTSDRFGPMAWMKPTVESSPSVILPVHDPLTGHITKVPSYIPTTGQVVMSEVSMPWWHAPMPSLAKRKIETVRAPSIRRKRMPSWNDQDVIPTTCRMEGIETTMKKNNITGLPERWVKGNDDRMTVRIVREHDAQGRAIHVLERSGGSPPIGWTVRINPQTFEPYLVPPANGEGAQGKIEENNARMERKETPAPSGATAENKEGVWFERERYITRAYIRDLRKIPRFLINTPTFQFDSHADNPGWMMSCKQRHFGSNPGKLVIKLVHEDQRVRSTVQIRPSNHTLHRVVKTEEDFVSVFQHDFMVETEVVARQVHQPLSSYTIDRLLKELNTRGVELTTDLGAPSLDAFNDEELLAELRKRSDARLDGWHPRQKKVDLTNVINIEEIRQNLPVLDEERLARILAA